MFVWYKNLIKMFLSIFTQNVLCAEDCGVLTRSATLKKSTDDVSLETKIISKKPEYQTESVQIGEFHFFNVTKDGTTETFYTRELALEDALSSKYKTLLERLYKFQPKAEEKIEKHFLQKLEQPSYKQMGLFDEIGVLHGIFTLIFDYKYARGTYAAFLEDVCVAEDQKGKGLGVFIMNEVERLAREQNAYKVILTCNEALATNENSPYVRAGYKKGGLTMRKDLSYLVSSVSD